jgi:hypothetical protein
VGALPPHPQSEKFLKKFFRHLSKTFIFCFGGLSG